MSTTQQSPRNQHFPYAEKAFGVFPAHTMNGAREATHARLVAELEELQRCLNKGWTKRGRAIIADLKSEIAELVGRVG